MTEELKRNETLRTGLLVAWGMVTLVLLFSVFFLVYEMAQQGELPFFGDSIGSQSAAADAEETRSTREFSLFFADSDSTALMPERRRMEYSESTVENCRSVLEALVEGPRGVLSPVLSPSTKVRGMFLIAGGELVLDFTRDLEAGQIKSAAAELLLIQSIANSLTQPAVGGVRGGPVRSVRFLFEGSAAQDTFPHHIDVAAPLVPDRRLIKGLGESPANG